MSRSFSYHVVRDRECIQFWTVKLSSKFAVNGELSASAVHNSLIPKKKTEHCTFGVVSKNSNNSNSRIIAFEFCRMGCTRCSAASRHEVLFDKDDFRPSSQTLELGDVLLLSQLRVTVLVL